MFAGRPLRRAEALRIDQRQLGQKLFGRAEACRVVRQLPQVFGAQVAVLVSVFEMLFITALKNQRDLLCRTVQVFGTDELADQPDESLPAGCRAWLRVEVRAADQRQRLLRVSEALPDAVGGGVANLRNQFQ